jgi:hypothetical protein
MLIPRLHQAITLLDNGRSPAEDGRNFVNEPEAGK